jgi:hypothetical protein
MGVGWSNETPGIRWWTVFEVAMRNPVSSAPGNLSSARDF